VFNTELKKFADKIGLSEQQIVEQFKCIGISIENTNQNITEKQKKDLLIYLENKYNKKEKVIKNERWLTLKRKKITKINVKGKNTIIITKRNHTYVKSDPIVSKKLEGNQSKKALTENISGLDCENSNLDSEIKVRKKNQEKNTDTKNQKNMIENKKNTMKSTITNKTNINTVMKENKTIEKQSEKKTEYSSYKKGKNKKNSVEDRKNIKSEKNNNHVFKNNNISRKKKSDEENASYKSQIVMENKKTNTTNENKDKKFNKGTAVKKKESVNYKKTNYKNEKFKKKKLRVKEEKTKKTVERVKRKKSNKILLDKDGEILTYGSKKYSNKNLKNNLSKHNPHSFEKPTNPVVKEVKIGDNITVSELAKKLSLKTAVIIKHLLNLGIMATINQVIDQDTALLVVEETGNKGIAFNNNIDEKIHHKYEGVTKVRPPIVTIMGHVDHGKTSLLDYIRKSNVISSESGNITQHIGAYSVKTDRGHITFLDTPGHAAFTAMRVRGSECTDLIILVVAADDGIMPQTIEAINHARAANVPILVAINKIDKPNLDMERIKNQLAQHKLIPEEWGGETIFINISAKHGTNVDKLLDAILLQSELLELKAFHDGPAEGVVVESKIEKGRGVVATLLVKNGRLKKGNFILAGQEYGKIRLLKDEKMKELEHATPSMPVEVLGLSSAPLAGNKFIVLKSEIKAKEIANARKLKIKEMKFYSSNNNNAENLLDNMTDNKTILPIILKTDVQGSSEAIKESLDKLSNEQIKILIVSSGIGEINESDVNLTIASKGILVAFNVKSDAKSRKLAQAENIKLNHYNIIYDLIDGIKKILSGKTKKTYIENIIGIAEIKDIFKSSKTGIIVGCKVIQGIMKKGENMKILRKNKVMYRGILESLRRFKDNINEVKNGHECGISIKSFNDVHIGDHIEIYTKDIDNTE